MEKKLTLVAYDASSLPEGMSGDLLWQIREHASILFYDSKKGNAPTILELSKEDEVKFLDFNTKKGKELLNKYSK